MKTATTRRETDSTKQEKVLYVALELGKAKWRVGSSTGLGQKPRQVWVRGGHRDGLKQEIERAKKRFGLAAEAEVVCCYEAGREGFWLHRYLLSIAVNNRVVDSSSIEVNRRARRAKTDRLDVEKLLRMLIRYESGETEVWSVVRAPKVDEEDQKQLHRELMGLRKERTRQHNRITGLLYSQGVELKRCGKDFVEWLEGVKLWDGSALPQGLVERLKREYERLGGTETLKSNVRLVTATNKDLEKAIAEGLDPRTPALAISRATRPDQDVVTASIAELPERLAQAGLPGPVLVMIGNTVSSASGAQSRRSTGTA